MGDLALDVGDDSGLDQDSGLLLLVEDGVLLGKRARGETDLVSVDAAPRQQLALVVDGQRVVLAAGNVDEHLILQRADQLRLEEVAAVGAGLGLDAELGVGVEAPGDQPALGVDDEGVVRAAGNLGRLGAVRERPDASGIEGSLVCALDKAAAELALLAGAPGEDLVLLVEGENVVGAGSEVLDFAKHGELEGNPLDLDA